MDEELLGELTFALEALDQFSHLRTDRHTLQRHNVALAGLKRTVEVSKADTVVSGLARKNEPLELARRVLWVEDDQLVAAGIAGEVAKPGAGVEVVLLSPHPLEARCEALLAISALDQVAPSLSLDPAAAPVQLEEHVAVEVGEDLIEVDLNLARALERRLGDRHIGARRRAGTGIAGRRPVVDHDRLLAQLLRLGADPADQRFAGRLVDQRVHRVQSLEGVLAVEDARFVDLVGFFALGVERAAAEVAVDRGASDQHREVEPALVQLLD